MIAIVLLALAAQAAPDAPSDDRIVMLSPGGDGALCVAGRGLCLSLTGDGDARALHVAAPMSGDAAGTDLPLPAPLAAAPDIALWPHLIAVPRDDVAGQAAGSEYLAGFVTTERTGYSGGGGTGGRLHLFRLTTPPEAIGFGSEVLDVVWDSSLIIRACFSERDAKDRLGACHDEYRFIATLNPAPGDGAELPALLYRSVATAYPQTARRGEDNSGQKLTKADLSDWRDFDCSYERLLHYNPATARYEMDRPAPDCSAYTTP